MQLSEMIERRNQLEADLLKRLSEFQDETGLQVADVLLTFNQNVASRQKSIIGVTVRTELA